MKMDISTNELWDELYQAMKPPIPFDRAKTVKMVREETGEASESYIRESLERMVKCNGWHKEKYKGTAYYWPPE